ncbi:MAG: carboxypeptidase regulatory-like domain-containing protein, partial [Bryobacteraceae bacterium]
MFIRNIAVLFAGIAFFLPILSAESSGGGTIEGTVLDPSGAAMVGASVTIRNPITNYQQSITTDGQGAFRFTNVPSNPYHLSVNASGFNPSEQDVAVRSAVPVTLTISLTLAGATTTVKVEAGGETLVENEPSAHTDMDRQLFSKMPSISAGSGLSDIITMSVGNIAADSNGFFHPQGDHAQTSFSIDGQPVSDQQSKLFSTQLPPNAVQSMELITGAPNAEYGDKTSLVVNATTRSGLGSGMPFGSFVPYWQSFGGYGEDGDIGFGTPKLGNFLAFNTVRSGRFLDSPEFLPIHDIGTNGTLFDRIDWQPNGKDFFHLNLFGARNWFQIPNTYDQPNQDQRQRVLSFNIAPGYQHVFNARTLVR